MNRYCGDVVRDSVFNNEVQNMISVCDGVDSCIGECQTAIQSVSYKMVVLVESRCTYS